MDGPETIPFIALLLAAGGSSRLGAEVPKPYLRLRGRSILEWNALRLSRVPGHCGTVVAADPQSLASRIPALADELRSAAVLATVEGGATRQESCRLAWDAAAAKAAGFAVVLVHDCARPFFSIGATRRALAAARTGGGAILGHHARDTVKRVDDRGRILATLPREDVFLAATPQVFARDAFERMLARAAEGGFAGTDEAALAEAAGVPVVAVPAPSTNVKLTWPEDLLLVPALEGLLEEDAD